MANDNQPVANPQVGNPQDASVSGERAWLAALLLRRQSRLMPRFALALARLRDLSRGQRRRLQRRAASSLAGAALVLAIGAASFGPLGAGVAQAATISVANGEIGITDNGVCSLIEAIINAQDGAQTHDDCLAGTAGADTIDLPAGGSFLFPTYFVYDTGQNGLPTITTTITIAGNGSTLDLSLAAVGIRLAKVGPTGNLTLNDTTVNNGLMDEATYGGGVFRVDGGTLTIDGSTLTGNETSSYGGAVFAVDDATLTITNSTLSGNSAFRGGAVLARDSAVTLTDSDVTGNTADRSGGGIQIEDGSLTLTGGTVNDNGWDLGQIGVTGYVDYAGGINAEDATVSITGTEIDGNYGGYLGGGVLLADVTGATITGATITGNTADTGGGIVWGRFGDGGVYPSTGVIRDSILSGNTADTGGGAALIAGELAIERTTVSDNTAVDGYGYSVGGGVANLGGDLTITQSALTGNESDYGGGLFAYNYAGSASTVVTNTTISGNSASKSGGGVSLDRRPNATFNNVTISDNEAADGGGLAATNPPAADSVGSVTLNRTLIAGNRASATGDEVLVDDVTVTANNYNLFGHSGITNGNAFNSFTPGATDITATSDGTTPTALAGILAALANNGGPTTPPTQTHALVSNSPALDRAPNAACVAPSPTDGVDQRDVARNQNGTGAAGPNECDVGAYEYAAAPPAGLCPAPANERTTILGIGMGDTKKVKKVVKLPIPNAANLAALYGQLVGKDQGPATKFVRFYYPNGTYEQVDAVTSPAPQQAGEFWYGAALDPAASIRGKWFLRPGKAKSPRAMVLYATYETPATYFNTYVLFDDGATNQVAAGPTWAHTQTFTIPIDPPTGQADITVQVALVDNDKDARAITVSAAAGAASDSDVSTGPTNGATLSLITLNLNDVAGETSEVVITLQTDEQGDSAAVVGAAVNYACEP